MSPCICVPLSLLSVTNSVQLQNVFHVIVPTLLNRKLEKYFAKRGTSDLLAQTLYRHQHSIVVYTKSVRESEQTSDISSQSSKSLFRKIQIFEMICIFCNSAVFFLLEENASVCLMLANFFTKYFSNVC